MTWQRDWLTGAADHLAALLPDLLVWSPTGYGPDLGDRHALLIGHVPDKPDRIITLTLVPLTASDTRQAHLLVGLVLRIRCAPRSDNLTAEDVHDAIFTRLSGATDLRFGDTPVINIWRNTDLSLGQDASGRDEHTATYHAWTVRASVHAHE